MATASLISSLLLTCLLVCKKEQVVYLPDYCAMLQRPLVYLRNAFLFAFADSSSSGYREHICECNNIEGLGNFCEQTVCYASMSINRMLWTQSRRRRTTSRMKRNPPSVVSCGVWWLDTLRSRAPRLITRPLSIWKGYRQPTDSMAGRDNDGGGSVLFPKISQDVLPSSLTPF